MACPAMVGRQGRCSQATAPGALHLSYHAPNYRRHMRQLRAAGASRCSPLTISKPAAWIPHTSLERWIRGVSRDRERQAPCSQAVDQPSEAGHCFVGFLEVVEQTGRGEVTLVLQSNGRPCSGPRLVARPGVPAPQFGQWKQPAGRLPRHAPPSHRCQAPDTPTAAPSRPRSQATVANSRSSSLQLRRGFCIACTSARAACSSRSSAAGMRTLRSAGRAASLCAMRWACAAASAADSSTAVDASVGGASSVMSGIPGCCGTTNPRKAGECRNQAVRGSGLRTVRPYRHPCLAAPPACAAGAPTPHACRAGGWTPSAARRPDRCRTRRRCDAAVPAAPPLHG